MGVRKFKAILADPPWSFTTRSPKGKGRNPDGLSVDGEVNHYATMALDDIMSLPVHRHADDDSVLFLWVLDHMIQEGLDVGTAWGFDFKTVAFNWAKTKKKPVIDLAEDDPLYSLFPMGTGYWTRANPELCLLFTKGSPKRVDAGVRRLIVAPRREHSRKPDCVHERIERLVDGPYLELFARNRRPGWAAWGNQINKFGETDV